MMVRFFMLMALCIVLCLTACSGKHKSSEKRTAGNTDLVVLADTAYFPENYHSRKTIRNLKIFEKRSYRGRDSRSIGPWISYNEAAEDARSGGARSKLLRAARSAIGTPYVVGGTSPGGFDCSGLVCWAYGNVGVKLPRTAREQSVVGRRISNISEMRAGDIVAFKHPRRGYHTGIYVGDGRFIHSPRRKTTVKINSLEDPYFKGCFLGARRVNLTGREDLLAQAESRLSRDDSGVSVRRYSREEYRYSRNASRHKRQRAAMRRLALAEKSTKSEYRRSRNYRDKTVASRSSDRKSRLVASNEKLSKRDRDLKRKVEQAREKGDRDNKRRDSVAEKNTNKREDKRQVARETKTEKRSKHKVVSEYQKSEKKNSKSDKRKKSSGRS